MASRPTLEEMEAILRDSAKCLECDAPECHEPTPEGVDVCAELPFWNGKPVMREMLREWQAIVNKQRGAQPA